jgi:hypothetical protein
MSGGGGVFSGLLNLTEEQQKEYILLNIVYNDDNGVQTHLTHLVVEKSMTIKQVISYLKKNHTFQFNVGSLIPNNKAITLKTGFRAGDSINDVTITLFKNFVELNNSDTVESCGLTAGDTIMCFIYFAHGTGETGLYASVFRH